MSMNIHAEPGTKVIFARSAEGLPNNEQEAAKKLVLHLEYTVAATQIHAWRTDVTLKEVPGVVFNSVLFDTSVQFDDDKLIEEEPVEMHF